MTAPVFPVSSTEDEPTPTPWEGSATARWAGQRATGWAEFDEIAPSDFLTDPSPPDTCWWPEDTAGLEALLDAAGDPRPVGDPLPAAGRGPASAASAADGASWAVPGVDAGVDVGAGLSRGSVAVLGEVGAAWQALRSAQARCYRALGALAASDAVAETGHRDQARLLEEHCRIDVPEARRLATQAAVLAPPPAPSGAAVETPLPTTAARVDDGTVGPGHVEVIRRLIERLHRIGIDPATVAVTEAEVADLATTRSPAALAAATAAILALLDPDGTAPDDEPLPDNELHYLRRRNGHLVGKFIYRDPAQAELVETALAAATPPPPAAGLDLPDPDQPDPDQPRPDQPRPRGESPDAAALRTLPARRAHALADLAAEALTRGLDHPDSDVDPDSATGTGTDTDLVWADNADGAVENDPTGPNGSNAPNGQDAPSEDRATDKDHTATEDRPAGEDQRPPDATAGPGDPGTRASSPEPDPDPPPGPREQSPPTWERPEIEGGERIALTVTLDFDTLRAQLLDHEADPRRPRLALLGDNTRIRPETARRLACDADLVPAVLGARSEPLDVGRRIRTVPLPIRRAVVLRDRHCAHPGCRRRPRRCHVHHITHWAHGGDTSLANCVLLCSYHHTEIHHSGWDVHMSDGQPWFTPPAWLDPQRRPRHNRPWQTTTLQTPHDRRTA